MISASLNPFLLFRRLAGRGFPAAPAAVVRTWALFTARGSLALLRAIGGLGVLLRVDGSFPFGGPGHFVVPVIFTGFLLFVRTVPPIPAILAAGILLVLLALPLLRLMAALLLGAFVKRGGEVLEGSDKMDTEISLGFVGFLNGLGHPLHCSGEMFQRGLDAFEGCRDVLENLGVGICFWIAHESRLR